MSHTYKLTITITCKDDLEKLILKKGDHALHVYEDSPAIQVLDHAVSGFAWDLASDLGIDLEDMGYEYEEVPSIFERPEQSTALEERLRELARTYSAKYESDSDAFATMKKIIQDELGY